MDSQVSFLFREVYVLASSSIVTSFMCNQHATDTSPLAAPQVGIPQSIAVYNILSPARLAATEHILINPSIVSSSDLSWTAPEGCLSLPDAHGLVTRPFEIEVQTFTLQGELTTKTFTGVEARVVQHEIDHLNGVLFTESGWQLENFVGSSICYLMLLVATLFVAKLAEGVEEVG